MNVGRTSSRCNVVDAQCGFFQRAHTLPQSRRFDSPQMERIRVSPHMLSFFEFWFLPHFRVLQPNHQIFKHSCEFFLADACSPAAMVPLSLVLLVAAACAVSGATGVHVPFRKSLLFPV